ncbi:sulfurtransferase complex subunit TusC [Marinimicrobium alkaliphilum]|uniref:sulfurtransferase complex subunit TusC n=1 Tax=Marinimicrobium alkaliphilum TaxID=2202654 RepID=UPI000DBA5B67|nr:sulfurtransferase complex subunit TusC [Marinimicrobium alkaliphilum]
MRRQLLFINRHSPYGESVARDALDAVMTAAAYDQHISLLFLDDGVFQLLVGQAPGSIAQKSLGASLPALPLYEVEDIYVHLGSLQARGLSPEDLILESVTLLDDAAVQALRARQDHILSF